MLGEPSRVRALPQTVYDRPSGGGGRIGAAVDGSQWLPAWASRLSSGKVRRQGRRRRRGGDEVKLGRTLGILVASALALACAPRAESFDGEGSGGSGGNGPEIGRAPGRERVAH